CSTYVAPVRIKLSKRLKLGDSRCFGYCDSTLVVQKIESAVVLHLFQGHALVQCQNLHRTRGVVEAENSQVGNDPEHASGTQATVVPRGTALQKAGAGNEIDLFDKAARLVLHGHDHIGQTGNVVSTARTGQTHLGVLGVVTQE